MKKCFRKLLALCMTALLTVTFLSVPALASVPSRPENQYVLDSAGVLSDSTEKDIISKNQKLFKESGGQIVIVAVDFLGGEEIDDYVYTMFNSWGIGSKERNNGILLVMAIGEDNYYAQAGYGIEDYFDGAKMQALLDDYLETDFAAGDYDAGVRKFFNAAFSELEIYEYNDEYDQQTEFAPGGAYENYGGYDYNDRPGFSGVFLGLASVVIRIVAMVVIVALLIAIIRALSRGGRGGPGSGSGGGGGFWTGMFLGNMLGNSRRRRWYNPPPPPPGGFGGPGPRPPRGGGGFGGFGGGSRGGFSGGGRTGGFSGGGRSGGFSGGGRSRGGGAGRR